jgi:bifunctional DNA-binding transcriptional regulator/antitoxin component of YhaV-PrlF toxin-antitoxin module
MELAEFTLPGQITIPVAIRKKLGVKDGDKVIFKAKKMAKEESLNVKLAILREKYGMKQSDISKFTQTAVSKLEKRKNIRISTLIDYLDSLDMGLEITACPRNSTKKELLLRV